MTNTRSLAVPPQPHGPLAQPAGAAVATMPPPSDLHARWRIRAHAELARLEALAPSPLRDRSLAVLRATMALDEEAWMAQARGGGGR